jgi:hypothetical protein
VGESKKKLPKRLGGQKMQKQAKVQLHVNNLYHSPENFNNEFEYKDGPQVFDDTEVAIASSDGVIKFLGSFFEWFYSVNSNFGGDFAYDYKWNEKNCWFKNTENGNIMVVLSQPKEL